MHMRFYRMREKRKNYDLYGDVHGNTGSNEGNFGNPDGYTYFNGGPGGRRAFRLRIPWMAKMTAKEHQVVLLLLRQRTGSFNIGDIFSNFFRTSGNAGGNQHGGFSSSGPRSNLNYPPSGTSRKLIPIIQGES
ncbi:hypothetical protein KSP40_PGU007109 [Platanthera guangdongensis]|uniref:Uncharacterized protein n=1 Tax=Platanthera guangdongensis TaxID=2320717 RepID=A0ABR2M8Z1_9ASPA